MDKTARRGDTVEEALTSAEFSAVAHAARQRFIGLFPGLLARGMDDAEQRGLKALDD